MGENFTWPFGQRMGWLNLFLLVNVWVDLVRAWRGRNLVGVPSPEGVG